MGIFRISGLAILIGSLALCGCVRESAENCPPEAVRLVVKAYDADGTELFADHVHDVTLYLFDGAERLVERIETQVGTILEIAMPAVPPLDVVAWGNLGGGRESVTPVSVGDRKSALLVSLLPDNRPPETPGVIAATPSPNPGAISATLSRNRAGGTPFHPCDDLFHGEEVVTEVPASGVVVVPIYRKAASMSITIRGLKEFSGFTDDDFHVVVSQTPSAVDFGGNYTGGAAFYRMEGRFDANGNFIVPAFNLLPGSGLTIEIYHGTQLVHTVREADGEPIDAIPGRLTNVLINLGAQGNVEVSVQMTRWGMEPVWKDF